jgi:hypothetical protein
MKYYCENCGSVFEEGKVEMVRTYPMCPFCLQETVWPFPDYETPEQYKARTGKELSDEAQVWVRRENMQEWRSDYYFAGKHLTALFSGTQILVGGPEPPPNDYEGK